MQQYKAVAGSTLSWHKKMSVVEVKLELHAVFNLPLEGDQLSRYEYVILRGMSYLYKMV